MAEATNKMAEIFFFIPDLNGGGAERALLNLLSHWPQDLRIRWRPTLVVRRYSGSLLEELPDWVKVISLKLPRAGIWSSIFTVVKLGTILRHEHARMIIPFLSLPSVVLASRLLSRHTKVVASVQNPLALSETHKSFASFIHTWVVKKTDFFLAISPGIAKEIWSSFRVPTNHVGVLPNSVDLNRVREKMEAAVDHPAFNDANKPVIITAARLAPQKRLDILLEAVKLVSAKMPCNLVILGEGPLREELENLSTILGIQNHTFFLGFQPNPWKFISKASVFTLTSDFEGFGNVLIEAMACGVPVVATKAPFGPEYIISDSECGLLVPARNPEALACAIENLIYDKDLRQHCIKGGLQRVYDFDVITISKLFFKYLESLISENDS